jgi:hypothetical protein
MAVAQQHFKCRPAQDGVVIQKKQPLFPGFQRMARRK